MPRFYISPDRWNLDRLVLDEVETHHATDVLRMKVGDRAVVFNGLGVSAEVEFAAVSKRAIELKRIAVSQSDPLPCRIILGQAIPKGKNMDLIVQKATELGADGIVPLLTERTVVQVDAREGEKKREKWQAVAVEASKQCGQNWLPQVSVLQNLEELLKNRTAFDLLLVASLQPGSLHPKEVLADYRKAKGANPSRVLVLIGPEGDFTPAEIAQMLDAGCRPITLGPIVLRTETAALYCLSVLSYELLG